MTLSRYCFTSQVSGVLIGQEQNIQYSLDTPVDKHTCAMSLV